MEANSYDAFVEGIFAELDYLAAPKAKARLQELLLDAELVDKPPDAVRAELRERIQAWEREIIKFTRQHPKASWNQAICELRDRGGKWERLYKDWERSIQIQRLWREVR